MSTPSWRRSTSSCAKGLTPVGDSPKLTEWSVHLQPRRVDEMATILPYTSPALGHDCRSARAVRAVPLGLYGFTCARCPPAWKSVGARLYHGHNRFADRGNRTRRLEG